MSNPVIVNKKNIFFIIILFLPFTAFVKYNDHQIEFTIELKNGKEIHGYNYLAIVYIKRNGKIIQIRLAKRKIFD